MGAESVLAEARHIALLLRAASDATRSIFGEIAGSLNLPVQQARALCFLEEPVAMTELARMYGCDKSYITQLADQMEEQGLVLRSPGPDRRSKLLQLTPLGATKRLALEAQIARRSPALHRLNRTERATLIGLLTKLVQVS